MEFLKEATIAPYTEYLRYCITKFSKKIDSPVDSKPNSNKDMYIPPASPVLFYILTHKDLIDKEEMNLYNGRVDEAIAELKKKNVIDSLSNYIYKVSTQNIGEIQTMFKDAVYIMSHMKEI